MKEKIKKFYSEKRNRWLTLGGSLLVVILLVVAILPMTRAAETGVFSDQEVAGLSFQKGKVTVNHDKSSTYQVEVKNTTKDNKSVSMIEMKFRGEDDQEIGTLYGYLGNTLSPGENKTMTASIDIDLTTATKLEYVLK